MRAYDPSTDGCGSAGRRILAGQRLISPWMILHHVGVRTPGAALTRNVIQHLLPYIPVVLGAVPTVSADAGTGTLRYRNASSARAHGRIVGGRSPGRKAALTSLAVKGVRSCPLAESFVKRVARYSSLVVSSWPAASTMRSRAWCASTFSSLSPRSSSCTYQATPLVRPCLQGPNFGRRMRGGYSFTAHSLHPQGSDNDILRSTMEGVGDCSWVSRLKACSRSNATGRAPRSYLTLGTMGATLSLVSPANLTTVRGRPPPPSNDARYITRRERGRMTSSLASACLSHASSPGTAQDKTCHISCKEQAYISSWIMNMFHLASLEMPGVKKPWQEIVGIDFCTLGKICNHLFDSRTRDFVVHSNHMP